MCGCGSVRGCMMVRAVCCLSVLLWLLGTSVAQKSPTEPISCQPDIYTQLRELRAKVESMRMECGDAPAVAFSASLLDADRGHTGPFNTDTVLIFKNIITNNGNAYNSNTGVFTVPVGGLYYFSFSSQSTGPHPSAVSLFKNGDRVVTTYDHAVSGTGHNAGNSAVLRLEAGDHVYLRLWARTTVYEDSRLGQTTFSGFVVSPT